MNGWLFALCSYLALNWQGTIVYNLPYIPLVIYCAVYQLPFGAGVHWTPSCRPAEIISNPLDTMCHNVGLTHESKLYTVPISDGWGPLWYGQIRRMLWKIMLQLNFVTCLSRVRVLYILQVIYCVIFQLVFGVGVHWTPILPTCGNNLNIYSTIRDSWTTHPGIEQSLVDIGSTIGELASAIGDATQWLGSNTVPREDTFHICPRSFTAEFSS
jgi:hypothetical protein